ncbi:myelin and lymphocyte protein-like isoform X2 [Amblyraja radiata]|uniref:myelin and lymphocyte protein-like isoform X2 n=1 Tax=Amblyraja radiata TaxID=386614 RepID=UPI001403B84D|nr:myelin and lymphocyte protein-like isoform X2 [Amblyraja radiata]
MSAPPEPGSIIPSGLKVCTSVPELLMLLEFVFGGLVWILVAASRIPFPQNQGWVMFVSVFCFVITTLLLILYMAGVQKRSSAWNAVVFAFLATLIYTIHAILSILRWKSASS